MGHPISFTEHPGDEPPEGGGLVIGERADPRAQAGLADGSDLVDRDLARPADALNRQTASPGRMKLAGDRADRHGLKSDIQFIQAYDNHRSGLGHFRPTRGIRNRPAYLVPFYDILAGPRPETVWGSLLPDSPPLRRFPRNGIQAIHVHLVPLAPIFSRDRHLSGRIFPAEFLDGRTRGPEKNPLGLVIFLLETAHRPFLQRRSGIPPK